MCVCVDVRDLYAEDGALTLARDRARGRLALHSSVCVGEHVCVRLYLSVCVHLDVCVSD